MSVVTDHCFIMKFIFGKTYFIKMDTPIEFFIIVSINFPAYIHNPKAKDQNSKIKTIDIEHCNM